MASQRRTRTEKQHISAQRIAQQQPSYTYTSSVSEQLTSSAKQKTTHPGQESSVGSMFSYDVELIYADLRKTLLITSFIFAVLIAIKFGALPSISALKF